MTAGGTPPTIVVTGASRGVGQAIAVAMALPGAHLALVGRDPAGLSATAREVCAREGHAKCFVADLASRPDVTRLAAEIDACCPSITVLVHAAGVFIGGEIASTSPADFDRALDVNLRAPYLLTQGLLPALEKGSAYVVFINSSVVGQRRAGVAAYGASKSGLVGMADSLRQEVNPLGIRVLSIFLGATATSMQADIYAREGRPYRPEVLLQPDDVAQTIRDVIALPRRAEVTDLHIRPTVAHRGQ